MSQDRPITLAVVGGTGAGKTTISNAILDRVGSHRIAYIPHDAYYKDIADIPLTQSGVRNFDHPDALDTALLIEHIRQLQSWQPVNIPVYDFKIHRRTSEILCVQPQPIILIEGILTLVEPGLRSLFDIKIFVDIDADIRLIRRLQRDIAERGRTMDSVIDQYLTTVRPMHLQFVEPSRRHADVIIPEGGYNQVAIDMVANRISSHLSRA
ncbi:MAG: uridine kinase [Anaerolineae bacterium]